MSVPVYSTRFIRAAGFSGGPTLQYTAADGYVTVVKAISVVWGDVVVDGLDCWVQDDIEAKLARVTIDITDLTGVTGGAQVFEGHWVYYPGETLWLQTDPGTADFHVAGYSLSLP